MINSVVTTLLNIFYIAKYAAIQGYGQLIIWLGMMTDFKTHFIC